MQNLDAMILDLAADDYTGLWELVWGAGAKTPEVEAATLRKSLLTALESLIADGKVKLYRGTTFTGEENAVLTSEAAQLLAREDSWEPPESSAVHLRVLTVD
jgi:hypothetical protein